MIFDLRPRATAGPLRLGATVLTAPLLLVRYIGECGRPRG